MPDKYFGLTGQEMSDAAFDLFKENFATLIAKHGRVDIATALMFEAAALASAVAILQMPQEQRKFMLENFQRGLGLKTENYMKQLEDKIHDHALEYVTGGKNPACN